ncbi:phosphatidate cytidylyltransferase [Ferrimicrobium sp.]|nr:phosphatidate cytidylyltransferase [Ferrimicrobium sp.]
MESEDSLFGDALDPQKDEDRTLPSTDALQPDNEDDSDLTMSLDPPYSVAGTSMRQGEDPLGEDATLELPGWRDPPTGEIPRIIEELAGEPLPRVHEEAPTNFDALEDGDHRSDPSPVGMTDDFLVPVEPVAGDDGPLGAGSNFAPRSEAKADPSDTSDASEGRRSPSARSRQTTGESVADLQRHLDERRGAPLGSSDQPTKDDSEEATETASLQSPETPHQGRTRHEVMRARGRSPRRRRSSSESRKRLPQQDGQSETTLPKDVDEVKPSGTDPLRRIRVVRTITGIVLALVFLGALKFGTISTLVVVVVAVTTAAAEGYNLLRRGGYRPAALVGLLAVIGLVVGAYLAGEDAIVLVMVVAILLSLVWFMIQRHGEQFVTGVTTTMVIVVWVGLFGAFAGLMLRHALFGDGGLGLLIGALLCATTADVFAFFGGSLIGKHRLAPAISPGKTVEGVLIGGAAAILVGGFVLPLIHPFTLEAGLLIGVAAAIIAPVGDLAESALKRSVSAKDSSRLLPGHGGMLDRIDGILIVLPVAFYLFLSLHLR